MHSIGLLNIPPRIPATLARLPELANNLYWSFNPQALDLFARLSPQTFAKHHNPVRVLKEAAQSELEAATKDKSFMADFKNVLKDFDAYMTRKDTWVTGKNNALKGHIAYFSMEFGLHESIQIYSGGLGVLAGDHCKSASDLGLPFTAIGLFYRKGYFHQELDKDGWQQETNEDIRPENMPVTLATDADGNPVRVGVEIAGANVKVQVYRMKIGRIELLLLDTDCPENNPDDRRITEQLYGAGFGWRNAQDLRVAQELVLGVGGIRILRALGVPATVFHMNEGHAAFLGLERCRELIGQGLTLREANEACAASGIFTTHTPVPAGNDAFAFDLIDRSLSQYWPNALGISRDDFLGLAQQKESWGLTFSMTVLALRFSRFANGVSELHGHVSRNMWAFLWPGALTNEVPIGHVTNGIHTRTFLAPELAALYNKHFAKNWDDNLEDPNVWNVEKIPSKDLWAAKVALKKKLIGFVRARIAKQQERSGSGGIDPTQILDENALTIGFARRFATYKRATLLFRDLERLKRIVKNSERPVQFIFAGKAHPADTPGKTFIQELFKLSREAGLEGRVIFLEDYDMNVARHLVQGCDIWLNNPRRPLEASGTSGEKASLNGCLNFSVLDGWWCEAYNGTNGWAIGDEREYGQANHDDKALLALQDERDARSLYETLENQIVPLYYTNEKGLPEQWLTWVRNAIKTIAPQFSMQRQVQDYVRLYYKPAQTRGEKLSANNFAVAKSLAAWKTNANRAWHTLRLEAAYETTGTPQPGDTVRINARVNLDGLESRDLRVEATLYQHGSGNTHNTELQLGNQHGNWLEYTGTVTLPDSGTFDLGVRAIPYRNDLEYPVELRLIRWA